MRVGGRVADDGAGEAESGAGGSGTGSEAIDPIGDGAPEAGADGADGAKQDGERQGWFNRGWPWWIEVPALVVVALVLAIGIKTFLVQAFVIPSDSMNNTLVRGDRVLVDKLTPWFGSKPERGEVVVFHDPGDWMDDEPEPKANAVQRVLGDIGLLPAAGERDLIKRVIAVGGDTVVCKAGSPVEVNGKALDEPYIYPGSTPCNDYPVGTIHVPKGTIWVMGDHRNDSADSRYHQTMRPGDGFVPVKDVVGRAFVVAWPVSHWATLPIPSTFGGGRLDVTAAGTVGTASGGLALAGLAVPVLVRRRSVRRGDEALAEEPTELEPERA